MSLEAKIETLTASIELLTAQVQALTAALHVGEQTTIMPAPVVEPEQQDGFSAPVAAKPQSEEKGAISFDDFKAQCLKAARDPDIGKDKVKEVISRYGAAKAADVKEADRAAVLSDIGVPF